MKNGGHLSPEAEMATTQVTCTPVPLSSALILDPLLLLAELEPTFSLGPYSQSILLSSMFHTLFESVPRSGFSDSIFDKTSSNVFT